MGVKMQYEFGVVPNKPILNEKQYKTIFNPGIARRLLKLGNAIIDIKPDRNNSTKTLFIFEINEKFNNDLRVLLNDTAK